MFPPFPPFSSFENITNKYHSKCTVYIHLSHHHNRNCTGGKTFDIFAPCVQLKWKNPKAMPCSPPPPRQSFFFPQKSRKADINKTHRGKSS
ncbi:hypothetical protein BSKO_12792 [Bryopsis sp. KO-2023]|nr:hypothetical protein BSKO_12792 [Bryopsis sp. KO-2023]